MNVGLYLVFILCMSLGIIILIFQADSNVTLHYSDCLTLYSVLLSDI